ncbi:MAG: UDP-3-O-acyl-N-acetylglucosamine deacetylase [Desulfuromonadaceae bacterium]|nr:UDP-3-O-acyl-N-acetylglucosamine deacetylase [Desulfuromonadaceae bacterium]
MIYQCTIAKPITVQGIGLHSGRTTTMKLRPATAGTGIIFHRTEGQKTRAIEAISANVIDTRLATVIGKGDLSVSTIEHFMAALTACHIDNLHVYIDGPEVPIMDGSAKPFIRAINQAGVSRLHKSRKVIAISKPITLEEEDKRISIIPSRFFRMTFDLRYDHPCIGRQQRSVKLTADSIYREIASARTFGFLKEVEYLKSIGLARGGSLENAIVIGEESILNPEGLRYSDEFVRHKILDSVGDFSLIGHPILGHIKSHKAGHDMNHKMVEKILASPDCWRFVEFSEADLQDALRVPLPLFNQERPALAES